MFVRYKIIVALLVFATAGWANADASAVDFEIEVRPLLQKLCVDCHGPEKQKGDIRFDRLDPDLLKGGDVDTWHDALDQIHLGEMPPEKADLQPTADERRILTAWLDRELNAAAEAKRNAGGRLVTRRLTRYEYANTMRDLLGVDLDYARELPPEPTSPEGFLNNGRTLEMSPTQIEVYLSAARRALDQAIVTGEKPRVFRVDAKQTAVGKLPRKKDGGAVPVNPEFILDVAEYPRSGEFEIVVRAGATVPEGYDFPRMRVSLGCVPGIIHVPRKLVGEVDVTATPEEVQSFVFRGRMEDYPQAGDREFGSAVAFKGVIVMIDFLDADGKELRYPHSRYSDPPLKPKKKGEPVPQLPAAPEGPFLDVVIDSVRFEAPVVASWPPAIHVDLLVGSAGKNEADRVRAVLEKFMPRAFRRPVSNEEIDRTVALFDKIRPRAASFEDAIRETLAAVLVSPQFLHLVAEPNDFSIASRLAYFLWNTMPDQRLTDLAGQGSLSDPAILAAEVERMMNDVRAAEFARRFADQWLDLGGLDRVAVNPEFFPDFDNGLKEAMRTETRECFAEILRGDLSCLDLLDANWTMVNRELAAHYGLQQRPRSGAFERVSLTEADGRGGLFGHGAFLLSNSNGESSHPIKRAVWILDRLLDSPPSSPPADVPDLDPESADLAGLTLKQQLAAHRKKASCNECHENIDPWGIALEHFDATGRFRTEAPGRIGKGGVAKPGPRLDPVAALPNGVELTGVEDLKAYLLNERREQFGRAVVKRLASYAVGRSLDIADRESVEQLTTNFIANDFRLRSLIVDLVSSDIFLQP